MRLLTSISFIVLVSFFTVSCEKESVQPGNLPTIAIKGMRDITFTSSIADCEASIVEGPPILSRGIVWSTSPNPTVDLASKTSDGAGEGPFVGNLKGLNKSTKYYVRAYATNSAGTAYSDEITFTTATVVRLQEIKYGTVTYSFEYDGQFRMRKRNITVSTVPNFIDSLVITYSAGRAVVKEYDSDTGLYMIQDHALNNDGFSVSYNQTLFEPNNFVLEYETGSLLKNIKTVSQTWYTFTHQSENMVTFDYHLGSTSNYVFDYYADKINSLELGFGIDQDYYGSGFFLNHHPLFGKANKNLMKKSTLVLPPGATSSAPPIKEFNYEFDEEGM